MYNQDDMQRAQNGLLKMISINLAIIIGFAAFAVVGMIIRQLWMTVLGFIVALCVGYGFWMLKTQLWVGYYKFIRDMLNGKARETEGVFVECSDEVRLADGVQVHDVMLTVDDMEEQLLFYLDDDKKLPEVQPGDRVRISSYGRFIREMTVVTEA